MKKINIIEYTEAWIGGGVEVYIQTLAKWIDKDKYNIRILTAEKGTDIYDEDLAKYGLKIEVLLEKSYESPYLRMLHAFPKFKKFIQVNKCDVVHIYAAHGFQLRYAKVARREHIQNIIAHCHLSGFHGGTSFLKKIAHNLGKIMYQKYSDFACAVSDKAAMWLFTKNQQSNVMILSPFIDLNKLCFLEKIRQDMRTKYSIKKQRVYLHIGRMNYEKNQIFLLQVFKEIVDRCPDSILIFIGEGVLEENIKEYGRKLKIDNKIIYISYTNEIYKYLNLSDVFILPSLFEGLPTVGLEAQANGLICYFSDTITQQAKILDSTIYVSLKKKPKEWAEIIINSYNKEYNRENCIEYLRNRGYGIECQIKIIEKMYG